MAKQCLLFRMGIAGMPSQPTQSRWKKIPIDIVGAWLHQKNLAITEYYSKPTESMVAEASDLYLARIATQINVDEAILRSPEELLQIYESARGKAGTLAEVMVAAR